MDLGTLSKEYSNAKKRSGTAPIETDFGIIRVDPFPKAPPRKKAEKDEEVGEANVVTVKKEKRKSSGGNALVKVSGDDSKKIRYLA